MSLRVGASPQEPGLLLARRQLYICCPDYPIKMKFIASVLKQTLRACHVFGNLVTGFGASGCVGTNVQEM
jgi:hypothetical protein